ncbi:MAG TPA: alkaline phosphatase PhoX [bacterium]|nr:alkaline phosphatase PhoX [bacterium]
MNSKGIYALLAIFFANAAAAAEQAAYLRPLVDSIAVTPLLTVGESVPRTSNPTQSFRLIGVPDGLGLERSGGRIRLWVNHELEKTDASQPIAGGPLQKGAFVSLFLLAPAKPDASAQIGGRAPILPPIPPIGVLSGDFAASSFLLNGRPWEGVPALFCSGFLAGPEVGFDRPIYLTGEEADGSQSGDGRGGLGFAFTEGRANALPGLGRYRKENLVVVPGTGLKTVLFGLEDGPGGLKSELYLYIGQKNLSSSDALARNGLAGGRLYVFGSATGGKSDESKFRKADRPVVGRWIPIDAPEELTDAELDAKAAESGAFRFDRVEDGTYDRNRNGTFYFVTTGGDIPENRKGRLYRLTFNPNDPLAGPTLLEILLEGDAGDGIVSPDNIDMNASGEMILLEDFTMGAPLEFLKRNPSVWLYRPASGEKPIRIAEVDGKFWESSGVIDASSLYGSGSWLLDVQAHTIKSREASQRQGLEGDAQLVEGGQLLLLKMGSYRATQK